MKIVLYCRRNVGMLALSYFVAKGFDVLVISDDKNILWLAEILGQRVVTFETMGDSWDYFFCVHGNKILPKEMLREGKMINIHPCLKQGIKGHNPVKRYLEMGMQHASVSSHYMTEKVDEGRIMATVNFKTGGIKTYAEFYNIAFPHYYKILDKTVQILLG